MAAAVVLLAGVVGCGRPAAAGTASTVRGMPATVTDSGAPPLTAQLYHLRRGRLVAATAAELAAATASVRALPWTVQARVAAVLARERDAVLAINGWGFARLEPGPAGAAPKFGYHYDQGLFAGRTITHLLPWERSVVGHLYYNTTLNTVGQEQLGGPVLNLVRLDRDGSLRPLATPEKQRDPRWESVQLVPTAPGEAFLEWKLSDGRTTRFRYSRLRLRGSEVLEQSADRAEFLEAFRFRGISDPRVPPQLRTLARRVIDQLRRDGIPDAFYFTVRRRSGAPLRLRYQPDGFADADAARLVSVSVAQGEHGYYALLPDGTLHHAASQGRRWQLSLPALPDGYRYLDLHLLPAALGGGGLALLATWEQARFFSVAGAGVALLTAASPRA